MVYTIVWRLMKSCGSHSVGAYIWWYFTIFVQKLQKKNFGRSNFWTFFFTIATICCIIRFFKNSVILYACLFLIYVMYQWWWWFPPCYFRCNKCSYQDIHQSTCYTIIVITTDDENIQTKLISFIQSMKNKSCCLSNK